MPLLNSLRREINCKIVYYGPGFGGKTTNLIYIHSQVSPASRGELISMATQTDRTLFFDFMPLEIGQVMGWNIRLSLYTVPGQVEYNASRKIILNGADAIVFVADSDPTRQVANVESLQNMMDNLAEYGISLHNVPWILQYNKRDLAHAVSLERLEEQLNFSNVPSFESVASEGLGVFATLRGISKLLLEELSKNLP
jgi:signal recognition particle receptor subunit beta